VSGGRRAAVAVLVAALALPVAAAHASSSETLLLDVHDPTPRTQPTAVAADALEAGRDYLITVSGTYSIVPADRWLHPAICGSPFAAPLLPSPGVDNGRVGLDAELQFARTADQGCSGAYPRHHNRFQIDIGNGFRHVPADGAPFTAPATSYRYRVTGTGEQPRFRVWDDPADDNYGMLRIAIAPVDPDPPDPPAATPPASAARPALGRCLRRRVLHLRLGSHAPIAGVRVTVDGRRWGRVRYGRRVTARVNLRHVAKDRVRVRVRFVMRDGRTFERARWYGTCARRARVAR
jgi:hypothetical protein